MENPVGTGFGSVFGVVLAIAVLTLGGFLAMALIVAALMLIGH